MNPGAMDPGAILALIVDLYTQVATTSVELERARARIAELEAMLAASPA